MAATTFLVVSYSRSIPSINRFAIDLASAGLMRTPLAACSTTFQFFLRRSLSKLQGPAPADESHRKRKQYSTVISPPLISGKKLRGACARKYPTAISPDSRKATGRVKRPSRIKATPSILVNGGRPPPIPPNIPKNFCQPCRENVNAATIRRRDRRCGSIHDSCFFIRAKVSQSRPSKKKPEPRSVNRSAVRAGVFSEGQAGA